MLAQLTFDFGKIAEQDGFPIAISGMLIVFSALMLISLFIAILPRVLEALHNYLPEESEHHGPRPTTSDEDLDEAVAVAIGLALRTRLKK